MGYYRHDAVIAIGSLYDEERAALNAEIDALRADMHDVHGYDMSRVLIGPIESPINSFTIFAYLPDGSKEGWDASDAHDLWRERFKEIMAARPYWNVLDVEFGGDEPDLLFAAACSRGGHVEAFRRVQPATPPATATNTDLWR